MDNDDVDGVGNDWENEKWRSSNWIEQENDGWLEAFAGSGKQKNAGEKEFVVNNVNCTSISFSFFVHACTEEKIFDIDQPLTIDG